MYIRKEYGYNVPNNAMSITKKNPEKLGTTFNIYVFILGERLLDILGKIVT